MNWERAAAASRFPARPDGFDAFAAADPARALTCKGGRPQRGLRCMWRATASAPAPSKDAFAFAAPQMEILDFPSWDCQPLRSRLAQRRHHRAAATALSRAGAPGTSEEKPAYSARPSRSCSACRR